MRRLSVGKWRGLQQTSTARGTFAVLALDHRGNLRRALNPEGPESVSDKLLVALKQDITSALAQVASAVLLDPEVGAAQCVASGALPGRTGLIVTVDASGYTGDPNARVSRLLEGWSVEKVRRMGASGAKLLIYYHPQAPSAPVQEQLVSEVAEACRRLDLAFFLEVLSFSADPARRELKSAARREAIVEAARQLVPLGADVLKAEFPLDVSEDSDEKAWRAACEALSAACPSPWLLLSAGIDFETYLGQVRVACEAGASGVMAGRAVWKQAASLGGVARRNFLAGEARERMARLSALCDALARPYTDFYASPIVSVDWHKTYSANGG